MITTVLILFLLLCYSFLRSLMYEEALTNDINQLWLVEPKHQFTWNSTTIPQPQAYLENPQGLVTYAS